MRANKTAQMKLAGILGLVLLLIGYLAFYRFSGAPVEPSVQEVQEPKERTIAVLPFVNMSSEPEQEYFSDGISEELLNVLAKIDGLKVAARTSSFSFKGKNIDIPTIAEQLNVNYVLEGSVRKAGNQVRITAQLNEANSDTHLWSETYDRTLNDIFATQDEIAAKVVEQLKIKLLDGNDSDCGCRGTVIGNVEVNGHD